MLVQLSAAAATMSRHKATMGRVFAVAMLAALTSACATAAPSRLVAADPSNPLARVPTLKYRTILGTYSRQRPLEPASPQEPNGPGGPQPEPVK
jgi:hypothetical protein